MSLFRRLTALAVIFTLVFSLCAGVCAQEITDDTSDAADSEIYDVSSGDVSASDTVTTVDHLAMYPLEEIKVSEHRLRMLVPQMEINLSADATNAEIESALGEVWGISSRDMLLSTFDYSDGTYYSYLYSGISANTSVYIYVIFQENAYTNYIGSYSGKSAEELEDICASTDLLFGGEYSTLRSIHGVTYVYQEGEDTEYGYYSYALETIINGGRYCIYIDLTDATEGDKMAAEEIIASLRIGGRRATLMGAADKSAVTVLTVCVAVLAAVVLLLAFFLVRFSLFSRAAGSNFNIIGFNMPPSAQEIEQIMKKKAKQERASEKNKGKQSRK